MLCVKSRRAAFRKYQKIYF